MILDSSLGLKMSRNPLRTEESTTPGPYFKKFLIVSPQIDNDSNRFIKFNEPIESGGMLFSQYR